MIGYLRNLFHALRVSKIQILDAGACALTPIALKTYEPFIQAELTQGIMQSPNTKKIITKFVNTTLQSDKVHAP